jgi:hypothetical protein
MLWSNQLQSLQARVSLFAYNDVIVHRNAERRRHRDDLLRHLHIGMRGRRIARGMIVQKHIASTIELINMDFRRPLRPLGTCKGDCMRDYL